MNLLFHILRAGHASGTHHKLALDALSHVEGSYAERWQKLILNHASLFFDGSKAPDNQFKDFKNHVLHVRDGLWGGAPEKAENWYQHLLAALRDKNWPEAAWCAGVLSHYYTDPIQPFHTGQSVAENNVHRAVEWSISRSYDKLADMGARSLPTVDVNLSAGDDWLKQLIIVNATRANGHYEALLAHYDFQRGVVDPPSGLDQTAQAFIGDLIQYAVMTFAKVLERAFQESAVVPPDTGITAATVLATLKLPIKAVLKRIDDRELRHQVEAMYDELKATGKVEKAMPEEERVVRALHAKEVLAKQSPPGPEKLDADAALSSNKAHAVRGHRPVVPQMQAPVGGGGNIVSAAIEPKVVATGRATPPAPAVTDYPVKRAAAGSAVPPITISAVPTQAAAVPAVAKSDPVSFPAIPEPVVNAPVVSPVAVASPAATASVEQTAADPDAQDATEDADVVEPAQPDAPIRVSAPLATAAATAAASAVSGLGGASLAGRLRAVARDDQTAPPSQPDVLVAPLTLAASAPSRVPSAPRITVPSPQMAHRPALHVPAHAPATLKAPPSPASVADPASAKKAPHAAHSDDEARCYLTPEHDVVDGPSIGPKTADRLKEFGIHTVADLFAADPGALAEQVAVAHIRAKTIAEWQDQARLVCEVPGLRGTHAQLLVGAGYRDLRRIARAEPRQLSADVLKFAQSTDGQRILRSGPTPDIEKIVSWVHAAEKAFAAKAA